MGKAKRVRLTDESLNSYGTRILTDGMDTNQYEKNPVLLYMHERGRVIGYIKDIKREEDGSITAEPVFDCVTDLSKQCKAQWEFGSLKMVSVGIDILEMSEEEELLVQGQTSPTITKSKLFEVSVVDIGANDNAIKLMQNGKQITLGRDGESPLPLLNNNQKKSNEMDIKKLALTLGLPETADEAAVNAKLAELQAAKTEVETLRNEKATMELSMITAAVEGAIAGRKITADKKEHFINLGKQIGSAALKATFDAIAPQAKLSGTLNLSGSQGNAQTATYSKLSEVPPSILLKLREENPEEYKRLFKAEYGMECNF
jgi:hypothetical protein